MVQEVKNMTASYLADRKKKKKKKKNMTAAAWVTTEVAWHSG